MPAALRTVHSRPPGHRALTRRGEWTADCVTSSGSGRGVASAPWRRRGALQRRGRVGGASHSERAGWVGSAAGVGPISSDYKSRSLHEARSSGHREGQRETRRAARGASQRASVRRFGAAEDADMHSVIRAGAVLHSNPAPPARKLACGGGAFGPAASRCIARRMSRRTCRMSFVATFSSALRLAAWPRRRASVSTLR